MAFGIKFLSYGKLYVNITLLSKILKLQLESVVMELKIELNRSKNLGLDIKYNPFELDSLWNHNFKFCSFFVNLTLFARTVPMSLISVDFGHVTEFFMFENIAFDIKFS